MNHCDSSKARLRTGVCLAFAAGTLYALSMACLRAADPVPAKEVKSETKTEKKAEKKKLTGAELYAVNCSRCHPERYPTEFNPAQWKTLMLHMRVRANLPAAQAKTILKYLQEEAGN